MGLTFTGDEMQWATSGKHSTTESVFLHVIYVFVLTEWRMLCLAIYADKGEKSQGVWGILS